MESALLDFFTRLHAATRPLLPDMPHPRVMVVLDGVTETGKQEQSLRRLQQQLETIDRAVRTGFPAQSSTASYLPRYTNAAAVALLQRPDFSELLELCFSRTRDADTEIAALCISGRCDTIISHDSDMVMYRLPPRCAVLRLDCFVNWASPTVRGYIVHPAHIAELVGRLPVARLPLLAALCDTDYAETPEVFDDVVQALFPDIFADAECVAALLFFVCVAFLYAAGFTAT